MVKLEEKGFGFHHIEVAFSYEKNAIPEGEYLVFNCELFISYNHKTDKDSRFKDHLSYEKYIVPLKPKQSTSVYSPTIASRSYNPSTLILPAKTCENERYWRLSAYANDRRVAADNEIVAGTYLTSDSELVHISSGLEVVGRYALPNPFPSIYAYSVVPERKIDINLGTVRPAFGQSGGGVEAVIQKASGKFSVSNHKKILPAW